MFWSLCIYINNFAFDNDAVLWSETICLDELVAEFLEIITISVPPKVEVGSNAFVGLFYSSKYTTLFLTEILFYSQQLLV